MLKRLWKTIFPDWKVETYIKDCLMINYYPIIDSHALDDPYWNNVISERTVTYDSFGKPEFCWAFNAIREIKPGFIYFHKDGSTLMLKPECRYKIVTIEGWVKVYKNGKLFANLDKDGNRI